MRRILLVAGLLVAVGAIAFRLDRDRLDAQGVARRPVNADQTRGRPDRVAPTPALEVLRSGSGMSHVRPLCETALAMGLLMGDEAFCLGGDGTQWSDGGTMFSKVPTDVVPATATSTVCPSGPNCSTSLPAMLNVGVDGGGYYWATGNRPTPSGSFSICALVAGMENSGGVTSRQAALLHEDSYNTHIRLGYGGAGPSQKMFVVNTQDAGLQWATYDTTANTRELVCGTYAHVLDGGTDFILVYDNGSCGVCAQAGSGHGHIIAGSRPWRTGGYNPRTEMDVHWGAFLTERVLTTAEISALDSAVRGTLTGSRGETVTTVRNSTKFCTNEDGSAGTTLPAHQACGSKGGLRAERSGVNVQPRSEELAAVGSCIDFGSGGDPTITSESTLCGPAPDGTLTAELINIPGAVDHRDGCNSMSSTAASGNFAVSGAYRSAWLWIPAGDSACRAAVADANSGTVAETQTLTSTPRRMGGLVSTSGSTTAFPWFHASTSGGSPCQRFCVWGSQVEGVAGAAHASSYIRTEGSTATRVGDVVSVPNPLAGQVGGDWCMAGTTVWPTTTTSLYYNTVISLGTYSSNNSARLMLNASTGRIRFDVYDNAGVVVSEFTTTVHPVGPTRFRGCMQGGNPYIWVDGVRQAKQVGGSNNITQPSTVYLGSETNALFGNDGTVYDFCVGAGDSCQ